MKKNVIAIALMTCLSASLHAQFSMGLKAGISSPREQYQSIQVGSSEGYNLAVDDLKFGTLLGGYMRLGKRIYVQPEVQFQTHRTDYRISESGTGESLIKRSSYRNLAIPLAIGIKMGPFRFHGGPVANYFLNGDSGLSDIDGFKEEWDKLTWGWMGGMTIGNGRLSADLRYEGNFNRFGDQISFLGNDYHFSKRPSSFVFALNYALVHPKDR